MFRHLPWNQVFPYLCHEIRKDRNNCVLKANDPSHVKVISFKASRGARDFGLTMRLQGTTLPPVPSKFSHPASYLMIHVDASFVGSLDVDGLGWGMGGLLGMTEVIGSCVLVRIYTLTMCLQRKF